MITRSVAAANGPGGRFHKLRALLRTDGLSGLGRHLRIVAAQRAHSAIEAMATHWHGADPTSGKHELSELSISSGNIAAGNHFLSTPWAVLGWVHAALPRDKAAWTFVDLGAGKGRAVLSAASVPTPA